MTSARQKLVRLGAPLALLALVSGALVLTTMARANGNIAFSVTRLNTANGDSELDVLVFATGFDAMTGAMKNVNPAGRNGLRLMDVWSAGPRTYLTCAALVPRPARGRKCSLSQLKPCPARPCQGTRRYYRSAT